MWTHTPAGRRRGGVADRRPRGRPAAGARGDARRPLPRPRQAGDDAVRGRPHPLARPRGSGAAAHDVRCSTAGTSTRSSATTCGRRCWRSWRPPEAGPALRRARARVATGRSAAWPASASPTCSTGWRGPTASGGGPAHFEPVAMEWFRERVRALAVEVAARAAAARPRCSRTWDVRRRSDRRVLRQVYERQLDGASYGRLRAPARRSASRRSRTSAGRGLSHPRDVDPGDGSRPYAGRTSVSRSSTSRVRA